MSVENADEAEAIARIRGSTPSRSQRRKPAGKKAAAQINWLGVREEYVTGAESFSQIGARYGVTKGAVEKHAAADHEANDGRSWGDRRAEFQEDVSRRFVSEAAKRQVDQRLSVHDAQAKAVKELVDAALPLALKELANDKVGGYDAVKAIVSILAAQRRVHGLERAMRVELTGKDGGAIEHDVDLGDALEDNTRALAERALEALFGKASESS